MLKFFSIWYVARQLREDNMPLGFITPFEENLAFERRKITADKWASGIGWYDEKPTELSAMFIKNELRKGFRIHKVVDRSLSGRSDNFWRIEDPHGFYLEIDSLNLFHILNNSDIRNKEIKKACIWARKRSSNMLVVEGTKEYDELLSFKASLKHRKPIEVGDRVILKSGVQGYYLGKYHAFRRGIGDKLEWTKAKELIFVPDKESSIESISDLPGVIYMYGSLNVLDSEKSEMTNDDRHKILSRMDKVRLGNNELVRATRFAEKPVKLKKVSLSHISVNEGMKKTRNLVYGYLTSDKLVEIDPYLKPGHPERKYYVNILDRNDIEKGNLARGKMEVVSELSLSSCGIPFAEFEDGTFQIK